MWNNTTTGDGCLDERVQLFISTDSQLQMARSDTLHLEILRGIASQLKYLGGEILEDGGAVHCGRGTDAPMARRPVLEVPVDTADGELKSRPSRA